MFVYVVLSISTSMHFPCNKHDQPAVMKCTPDRSCARRLRALVNSADTIRSRSFSLKPRPKGTMLLLTFAGDAMPAVIEDQSQALLHHQGQFAVLLLAISDEHIGTCAGEKGRGSVEGHACQ